jgi:hypothetical protein
MKYKVGDIFIPVSEEWKDFGEDGQRIEILEVDSEGDRPYCCRWLNEPPHDRTDLYWYSEADLNEERLDEVTQVKRLLEEYDPGTTHL